MLIFKHFMDKDSVESSVNLAKASGFGRTQFWPVRSFTRTKEAVFEVQE